MKRKLLLSTVILSQITTIGLVASANTNTTTEQNTRDIMEVKPGTPAPQPSAQLNEQKQDVTKTWDRAEVVNGVTAIDVKTRDIMEVKPGTPTPQPSAQLSEQNQDVTKTWDRAEVVNGVTANDVNKRDIMEVKPGTPAPQPSAQLSEQHHNATVASPMEQSQQKVNVLPDTGESHRTNAFLTFFTFILGSFILFHKKQA